MEVVWISAFWMGIISACSLPLGCLTTVFWKPNDRAIAFFMAFGGGALLAALTIDLVASSLDEGHFNALALGCIFGGLLFIGLNEIINDFGGFLRKASTRVYHIRKQQHKQFKRILSAVHKLSVFDDLSDGDLKALAASVKPLQVKKGAYIYRCNDPPDNLYIVADGLIDLIDPTGVKDPQIFNRNETFGWLAFFTGSPYRYHSIAKKDSTLWQLPRTTFTHLVPNSPTLLQSVHLELRTPEVSEYLQGQQNLPAEKVKKWCDNAVHSLLKRGIYNQAIPVDDNSQGFLQHSTNIDRLPIFRDLPIDEIKAIASRLIFKHYSRGETFFHQADQADRMYFIASGEVSILDARTSSSRSNELAEDNAFGFMAFLTGGRHTVSALATTDSEVWTLRRQDFQELVKLLPELSKQLKHFIQQPVITEYLEQQQGLNADTSARWCRNSLLSIDNGAELPTISDMVFDISGHQAMPLSIWLGLLLDGIPEALVIGANMAVSHVGLSLLSGLFLSNYPEALSSSVGMRHDGMKFSIILFMWVSLMLLTGIISALGSIFFVGLSPSILVFTQGVAAGSMLTMIAQTMLPEAYLKGGSVIGFSTLLGFLAAIFFKTLE